MVLLKHLDGKYGNFKKDREMNGDGQMFQSVKKKEVQGSGRMEAAKTEIWQYLRLILTQAASWTRRAE